MRVSSLVLLAGLVAGAALFSQTSASTNLPGPRPQPAADSAPRIRVADGSARTMLNVRKAMAYGDFVWNDDGVAPGPITIKVDRARQIMSVMRGGDEIGTAVITYGADSHPTPAGRFPIRAKLRDHHSRTYDAPMPYTLWLTDDGVSVHGVSVRANAATHGCVGIPEAFARRLFEAAKVGDIVEIS